MHSPPRAPQAKLREQFSLGVPNASALMAWCRDLSDLPEFKGCDGCRAPMPWSRNEQGGFSSVQPWLPIPDEHRELYVDVQEQDSHSVLNAFRSFLRWRKMYPPLYSGEICFVELNDSVLAFTRSTAEERLLIAFHLAPHALVFTHDLGRLAPRDAPGVLNGSIAGQTVRIPGYGAIFASVT